MTVGGMIGGMYRIDLALKRDLKRSKNMYINYRIMAGFCIACLMESGLTRAPSPPVVCSP